MAAPKPHECDIYTHRNGQIISQARRPLLEQGLDTFIRYNEAISILHKVKNHQEPTIESKSSSSSPFGMRTFFEDYAEETDSAHSIKLYFYGGSGYIEPHHITRNHQWIEKHKVLVSKAYGAGNDELHQIIGKPIYAEPGAVCTETYIVLGVFDSEQEAQHYISYIRTKFFRFLVGLKKNTQDATKKVYSLVPLQDFSHAWNDELLYKKYGLDSSEIAYIESMIKGM